MQQMLNTCFSPQECLMGLNVVCIACSWIMEFCTYIHSTFYFQVNPLQVVLHQSCKKPKNVGKEDITEHQVDLQIGFFRHTRRNPWNIARTTTTWMDTVYRINYGNQTIKMLFFKIFPWLAPSHHLGLSSNGIATERLFLIIRSVVLPVTLYPIMFYFSYFLMTL